MSQDSIKEREQKLSGFLCFFRIHNDEERSLWTSFIQSNTQLVFIDQIYSQLRDLVKLEHPQRTLSDSDYTLLIEEKLSGTPIEEYGVWVYYPWKNAVVHMLDEEEFIRVRTIRNVYKITHEEQAILRRKKIGIIGLSVGQSVAMTIALERGAGELRIADFDTLELSNLNRIRTGVHNIGLKKTEIVAREIAEIDPFIKVVCYDEGVNPSNVAVFFEEGGMLDLLIEECDSVDIKILAREEARRRGIPVIMDTSDRGMIDIERFDSDRNYPILHGLIDSNVTFEFLSGLKTSEEKLPYIIPILGADNLSVRLKASGLEVGKTITTWPQLGSDVVLGGALCANVAKRILLGEKLSSGRSYVDFEKCIPSMEEVANSVIDVNDGFIDREKLSALIAHLKLKENEPIDAELLNKLIYLANLATSPGNSQKWLWYYISGNLLLFLDKQSEKGFADNFSFGSLIGLGSALENLKHSAKVHGFDIEIEMIDDPIVFQLTAIVRFKKSSPSQESIDLYDQIENRCCNRRNVAYNPLDENEYNDLLNVELHDGVRFDLINNRDVIKKLGDLICKGDRIRLTNLFGHKDFFENEIRWSRNESKEKGDGLDITLFDLTELDKTGLNLSKDSRAIEFLNKIDGGSGFERISEKNFDCASALGIVSIDKFNKHNLVSAGMDIEKIWLFATKMGLGFQPYTVLQMLFSRIYQDNNKYINQSEHKRIMQLKFEFESLLPGLKDKESIFLFRLTKGVDNVERSYRKAVNEKLIIA